MMTKEENKQRYMNLLKSVKREGIENLIAWLDRTDFFEAPASARFHNSFIGGLCDHSLKVYDRFVKLLNNEYGNTLPDSLTEESVILISLLHDVCKTGFYKTEYKNVKDENGNWIKQPYFAIDDDLPYGHGEKSVYMINGYIRLTREEAMAINWHMGEYDDRVKGGSYAISKVFYEYPTAFLFHLADLSSTYLDEKSNS